MPYYIAKISVSHIIHTAFTGAFILGLAILLLLVLAYMFYVLDVMVA